MKQLVVVILSLLVFLGSAADFVSYVTFKVNQKGIAEVFCINKKKPALKCDGKCYLAKMLQQSQEKEKEYPARTQEDQPTQIIYTFAQEVVPASTFNPYSTYTYSPKWTSRLYNTEIFHPPIS